MALAEGVVIVSRNPDLTVSSAALNLVFLQLKKLGIDASAVLQKAGFKESELSQSLLVRYELGAEIRFWQAVMESSSLPFLHIELASKTEFGDFLWGDLLFASAGNLKTALHLFEIFSLTITESWLISTAQDDYFFYVHFNLAAERSFGRELIEFGMLNTSRRVFDVTEGEVRPIQVLLKREVLPDEQQVLERAFQCAVVGNAASNSLLFMPEQLGARIRNQNSNGAHLFAELAEAHQNLPILNRENSHSSFSHLKYQITRHFFDREAFKTLSVENISSVWRLGHRTLQRFLKQEKTTYRKVYLDIRMKIAAFYLESTKAPIREVAKLAGYANESNFLRAFKAQYSMTPAEYRARYLDKKIG